MNRDRVHRRGIENSDYILVHEDKNVFDVDEVQEQFSGSTYVGEFSLPTVGSGWANMPVSVFWQPEKHPEGSNYFGLYVAQFDRRSFITDALPVTKHKWVGVVLPETKEIMYSAFRHDCQTKDGYMIDGGPEYTRTSGIGKTITFYVQDGKIFLDNPENLC